MTGIEFVDFFDWPHVDMIKATFDDNVLTCLFWAASWNLPDEYLENFSYTESELENVYSEALVKIEFRNIQDLTPIIEYKTATKIGRKKVTQRVEKQVGLNDLIESINDVCRFANYDKKTNELLLALEMDDFDKCAGLKFKCNEIEIVNVDIYTTEEVYILFDEIYN